MDETMIKPNLSISIARPEAVARRRRQESRSRRAGRLAVCSVALALAIGVPATAAAYTVLNTDDAGPGSLRQAVLDANSNAGADAIDFDAAVVGTIDLGDELAITDSLTITGPGADQLTIDGGGEGRIFNIDGSAGSVDVSISGLTLTNGHTPADKTTGGALRSSEAYLSLTDVTVSKSVAQDSIDGLGYGGGIYVDLGGLKLANCEISDNLAGRSGDNVVSSLGIGGGVYTSDADVSIEDCLISGNQALAVGSTPVPAVGGGLALFNGKFTIHRSQIVRNLAGNSGDNSSTFSTGAGGGVIVGVADTLITESVIADNIAGNTGTVQFVNAAGGGIADLDHVGTTTLENVTVSGNRVGGVSAQDSGMGGGLFNSAVLMVRSSTIANNSVEGLASSVGGGIATDGSGSTDLHNSIVADNSAVDGPDMAGGVDATFSLIENQTGVSFLNSSSAIAGDPGLGLLEDNGGPTPTQAISNTSPAFNAGDPFDCPATDQRGVERPQGAGCDIGAFELVVAQSSLLETFDGLADGGAIQGDGPGKSANNRLKAMRNKLALIEDLISGGDTQTACEELSSALLKTDGQPLPPDFVQGAGAADLAAAIRGVQSSLGCQ